MHGELVFYFLPLSRWRVRLLGGWQENKFLPLIAGREKYVIWKLFRPEYNGTHRSPPMTLLANFHFAGPSSFSLSLLSNNLLKYKSVRTAPLARVG